MEILIFSVLSSQTNGSFTHTKCVSICGVRADLRTAFMPDSEEIEPTRTKGSEAKLSERGANPRHELYPKKWTKNPLIHDRLKKKGYRE